MSDVEMRLGPLMKAARKFRKYNQSDVAKAIGCSQSALSKMEHNLLVPSAPQWFLFARFTKIPPESLESGVIDRHSVVRLNSDEVSLGYKLPKRYRINRAQKVREVYPFMVYLERIIDGQVFEQFMASVGIEPEFFLDFDNLINFQLLVDLINVYVRIGKTNESDLRDIADHGLDGAYWGQESFLRLRQGSLKDLLSAYALDQRYFQTDFILRVEEDEQGIIISYRPEPHLYYLLKDVTDEVGKWLTIYRRQVLLSLSSLVFGRPAQITPLDLPAGPLESRFRAA